MSNRDITLYVIDIYIAVDKISRYTQTFTNGSELLSSELHWDATIRELEVIGEATKYLLKDELIEKKYFYILTGLEIGCVAYLLNAFFYDITYYPWFWNLIIINRLLCIHLQDRIQRA